jgi:hypothetical protein
VLGANAGREVCGPSPVAFGISSSGRSAPCDVWGPSPVGSGGNSAPPPPLVDTGAGAPLFCAAFGGSSAAEAATQTAGAIRRATARSSEGIRMAAHSKRDARRWTHGRGAAEEIGARICGREAKLKARAHGGIPAFCDPDRLRVLTLCAETRSGWVGFSGAVSLKSSGPSATPRSVGRLPRHWRGC